MSNTWHRFRMLGGHDRGLAIEAAVLLPVVWIGLRLLSFLGLRAVLDRYANRFRTAANAATIDRAAWAVNAVADRSPVSMTCLVRALAADTMLRRHGFAPQLRIGVRRGVSKPLDSHAWVECDGRIVIGQLEDVDAYGVMAPSGRW